MAKPVPTEKRCRLCDTTQPIVEFYPHEGYADGFDNRCRTCANSTPKSEKAKLELRIKSRAHNRAMARLKDLRPLDYERLLAVALVEVREEAELLGPTARLKTGPARAGESLVDRIKELCVTCGTSHEQGHKCPHCGRHPDDPPAAPAPTPKAVPQRPRAGRAAPPITDAADRRKRLAAANARILREREDRARAAEQRNS